MRFSNWMSAAGGLGMAASAWAQGAAPALDAAASAAVTLPAVRVQGSGEPETPTGPVRGFVARRAATASKTDTPLAETPQSISVITRDQMDQQNAQSVSDALRYSAGVMAESNGPDPRADMIQIRGFSAGARSAYRDGLRDYAFNGQGGVVVEPYGLERIEVLRGPASVLYGQGDAGGIVNLVTKRPPTTALHEAVVQFGSFDRKQGAFDLGGPVSEGSAWRYRLTVLGRSSGSQIDEVRDDRVYIAPALTWQPSAATSFTLLSEYQQNRRGQGYQALPRIGTLVPSVNGIIPASRFVGEPGYDRFDQDRTSIGYQFEHHLDERWTLRQNLRWMAMDSKVNTIYQAGLLSDDSPLVARAGGAGRERVGNFSVDNQAQLKLANGGLAQTILVGVDFQRLRGKEGSSYSEDFAPLDVYRPVYGSALPISAVAPPDDTRHELDQVGVYAQDQLKFGEHWAVTLSGRYDSTRRDNIALPGGTGQPQRDHAFTWRSGLVYLTDSGLSPYVGYATSFTPIVDTDAAGRAFDPETGKQFEVGLRYEPKGSNLSALASLFDLRRRNVLTEDLLNPGYSIQRGELRSRGLEVEVKASLNQGLDLIAAYTWNDVKVTQSNGEDLGKTPSATPRQIASLWASVRPGAVLPGVRVAIGGRYVGKTYGDEVEGVVVPAYTLLDAALDIELGRLAPALADWTLALNVSNLADKHYVATCGYYADGCRYGYGRSGALTVAYRW